eukprot:CAMPEP_0201485002 /NCGR_PEP_ID=MMETSP0151_2-20130828/9144_1 /ASSEMBLY_ACC=CAM_ASM_000257 /TAXON_ID=200890 /ORGANISM="Paramoeba atlantica, Strain 621/1 / CCAP 1560/9" /LENGTH=374 /DNA_ID=CAMNT_0047868933 /DNA_START=53 /DNA_END=1177 /DNA_ORIENTATION=-
MQSLHPLSSDDNDSRLRRLRKRNLRSQQISPNLSLKRAPENLCLPVEQRRSHFHVGFEVLQNPLLEHYELNFEEVRRLGKGSFGEVFLSINRITGCPYAIKAIPRTSHKKHWMDNQEVFHSEVQALSVIPTHDNITKYYTSWAQKNYFFIQMEYCETNLAEYAKFHQPFSEADLLRILSQIVDGLACLEQIGMVHLDIKPENIFVTNGIFKIGDFGLARPSGETTDLDGEARYVAPEILDLDCYQTHPSADIFSLGVIMWELTFGKEAPAAARRRPVSSSSEQESLPESVPEGISQEFIYLIQEMTKLDPFSRPSASSLLHYLKNLNTTIIPSSTTTTTPTGPMTRSRTQIPSHQNRSLSHIFQEIGVPSHRSL